MVLVDYRSVGGFFGRVCVTILAPFFTFPTHVTPRALSFPCHLPTGTQHVPPNHGTHSCLYCTHMHYPICPCPCLVPYGYAAASYHIPLTRSLITHSSPLVLYTFPILVCFLIPVYVIGTSCFTFIRGPMLLSLILYYT